MWGTGFFPPVPKGFLALADKLPNSVELFAIRRTFRRTDPIVSDESNKTHPVDFVAPDKSAFPVTDSGETPATKSAATVPVVNAVVGSGRRKGRHPKILSGLAAGCYQLCPSTLPLLYRISPAGQGKTDYFYCGEPDFSLRSQGDL